MKIGIKDIVDCYNVTHDGRTAKELYMQILNNRDEITDKEGYEGFKAMRSDALHALLGQVYHIMENTAQVKGTTDSNANYT